MPRVSVIIPSYNRADYVQVAIQSVLQQTYQDLEIIVCDDGSTDNTVGVVKSIQAGSNLPIIIERLPYNLGVSAARNRGIFLAHGELIAFLDSDDSWKPEKLEKQINFLDNNPEFIGVGCNLEVVSYDNRFLKKYKPMTGLNSSNELFWLLYSCYITTSCFVVKRNPLLLAGLFDIRLNASEDRDLWYRLPRFGRLGYLEETLVSYRKHASSISNTLSHLTGETYIPVILKTIWYWKDKLSKKQQQQIISNAHLLVAHDAASAGKLFLSIKHSLIAMLYRNHFSQAFKLIIENILKQFPKNFTRRSSSDPKSKPLP
jgi:glycosyltransferase involved in cell wall biosynthesis